MRKVADLRELERGRPAILTIGAFDGVHRGHQFLMRQVVDRARRLDFDAVVVSFDPSPAVVLRPGGLQLASGAEKARIIRALGPDFLVTLRFTRKLSELSAGRFLMDILDHINLAEIWVGADFAFGHNREGNVDFLVRSGQQSGFDVHVLARRKLGEQAISSSAVRGLLTDGDVGRAAVLLGHYFRFEGRVERGVGRGHDLGFPTANLEIPDAQLLPGSGIYAGHLHVDDSSLPSAISVGTNPQFDGDKLVVEAYALDFDGDLRGKTVGLDFVQRLRDEKRFPSVDDLKAAMTEDVAKTRQILATAEEPGELILT
jgi:riboflavin kinase / FMN adenylyltransferase